MKSAKYYMALAALGLAALAATAYAQSGTADRIANPPESSSAAHDRIAKQVRHELVMLPYYSVFDNLEYQVNGGMVTLSGQVTRPSLKSSAEDAVKGVEGVTKVDNRIEVLPLSPMDDGLRIAEYHAIYGTPGLDRYALQAVPPIHIVVANGKVTLVGTVASQGDKDRAGIAAKGVKNVFSVTNNLRVEKE